MNFTKNIILASASPRRHEILLLAGIPHRVFVPEADESTVSYLPYQHEKYVMDLSVLKNRAAAGMLRESEGGLIISADTVVFVPGEERPLGKPKDRNDASEMLRMLSGKSHDVVTGVTVSDTDMPEKEITFSSSTKVFFRNLSEKEIIDYLDSGEPYDKAGAYGIQGRASTFVDRIEGDYFNVVGLPVARIMEEALLPYIE